jgi:predicted nucleic acid-binding protein
MTGTLLAKERAGLIPPALRAEIQLKFDEHVASGVVRLISLKGMTVHEGAEIMHRVHPLALRTLDALHLATCLSVEAGPLFTRDHRMRAAAVKLGIPLAD